MDSMGLEYGDMVETQGLVSMRDRLANFLRECAEAERRARQSKAWNMLRNGLADGSIGITSDMSDSLPNDAMLRAWVGYNAAYRALKG